MDTRGQPGVVVADDDPALRLLCRVNLELEGYRVYEAATAEELEGVLETERVDGVLLDIRFGSDDGVAVAERLRGRYPDLRIAFLSGSLDRGERGPVEGFLAKPFSLEALAETARRLVHPS